MQALSVPDSPTPISRQLQATVWFLARRQRLLVVGAGFAVAVAAALAAPGGGPSLWEWTRMLLVLVAATIAGAALASAPTAEDDGPRLAVALAATLLALVVAATFGVRSAALCSVGLSIVDAGLVSERLRRTPDLVVAALAVLIAWWVWTALGVWDDRLLLLAPLAALALNGVAHARLAALPAADDAHRPPIDHLTHLTEQGHLLGSWLSLAAAAALTLLVGVGSGAESGWLVTGGLASATAVAVGVAGARVPAPRWRRLHPVLSIVAFGLLGLTWLASL